MSKFQNDSIFWIEVEKIKPNPYQPRKQFSDEKLGSLADSIRQYGILQPLVVTRSEVLKPDGGLMAEYELIAGERRLRASKIAGLLQVPAIIREGGEDDSGVKLELAIIENLQREDLNPIDRALAFQQLAEEFGFKHTEIAKKVGKSREYVSNSLRLLALPEEMRNAISGGQITEGHARPILMLKDRPEEQATLFKEVIYKKLTVRDAEAIARKIAHDKVRTKMLPPDPEIMELEGLLAESLGTRVQIERKEVGGKLTIDFFSNNDLKKILDLVHSNEKKNPSEMLDNYIKSNGIVEDSHSETFSQTSEPEIQKAETLDVTETIPEVIPEVVTEIKPEAPHEIATEITPEIDPETRVETGPEAVPEAPETTGVTSSVKEGTYMMGEAFHPSQPQEENPRQPEMSSQPEFQNNNQEQIKPVSFETNENTVELEDGVEITPGGISQVDDSENNDDLYSVKDFTI